MLGTVMVAHRPAPDDASRAILGNLFKNIIMSIKKEAEPVREFIETVEAYHRGTQQLKRVSNTDCRFGYRDSLFKAALDDWTITAVEFRLPRVRELRLDYTGVKEELAAMGVERPRPAHVAG